jgi:hypothetical protein
VSRPRKIDLDELKMLVAAGWSNQDLQKHFGTGKSALAEAKKRLRLSEPRNRHDFPWEIAKEHYNSAPHQYLMVLSNKAGGVETSSNKAARVKIQTAVNWARDAVRKGFDLEYSPRYEGTEISSYGGWYFKVADPEKWYLRDLLEKAETHM